MTDHISPVSLPGIYHTADLTELSFLITGGAGFIGSHMVNYLLKHGAKKVRVLDNLSTGTIGNLSSCNFHPAFEFIKGDIRDLETCKRSTFETDYICHLAALGSVPRSIHDPISTNQVNIDGFLNMLTVARDQKVRRIVYAASSSSYGDSTALPKQEDHIGNPLSPYAVTKLVNELYADVFFRVYGTDSIGLRYFNVFGPKQDPEGDYAAVIPRFMKSILDGQPATFNGDGSQSRDFTYIENVVQANILAMLHPMRADHHVYNVACGEQTSLLQIWEHLKALTGTDPGEKFMPSRPGDIKDSLADISRITADLSYVPNHPVLQGLELTLAWMMNNK